MSFWDRLKNYNSKLLLPLVASSFLVVFVQSFSKFYDSTGNDYFRIAAQLTIFLLILTVSGFTKFYFFYVLGKDLKILKTENFSDFFSKLFSEWVVTEVRVQLRTLFYLLLFIIPGVIEALRLTLSPVHVFFNPKMENQDFDPVMTSRQTLDSKQSKILFFVFLIHVVTLALQLAFMEGSFFSDVTDFVKALLGVASITITSYFYYIYITHLYFKFNDTNTN